VSQRLQEALERLERALVQVRCPVVEGLQPGLTEADIRGQLGAVDLDPPEDLITLFGWHNGYHQPSEQEWWGGWIGPSLQTRSLAQALDDYPTVYASIAEFDEDDPRWLPVMWCGDPIIMYCGDDSRRRGTITARMYEYPLDESHKISSLAVPIEWWAGFLETGDYRFTPLSDGTGTWDSLVTADRMTADQLSSGMV